MTGVVGIAGIKQIRRTSTRGNSSPRRWIVKMRGERLRRMGSHPERKSPQCLVAWLPRLVLVYWKSQLRLERCNSFRLNQAKMGGKDLARLDIGAEIRKEKDRGGRRGDKIPQMDKFWCRSKSWGCILHLGHLLHRRGSSTMQREREKRQMLRESLLNVMASIRIRTSTSNSNYCFDFDWTLNHPPWGKKNKISQN